MARFTMPRDIYYGRGALAQLRKIKGQRAMVICSPLTVESGFLRRAEGYLQSAGLMVRSYTCLGQGPTLEQAQAGAKAMQEFKPDWIIALGGETTVSAAKAMWVLFENPALQATKLGKWGGFPPLRKLARLIIAPAGSGGEGALGGAAFVLDISQRRRYLLQDPVLTPDLAIIDPDLAATVPPLDLGRGGMAALSQALETLCGGAGAFADALAYRAALDMLRQMESAAGGDLRARSILHEGQCMAGLAFANGRAGLCQILAANLCAAFYKPLPTGICEAICLPLALPRDPGAKEVAARISRGLSLSGDSLSSLCGRLAGMRKALGLPRSLEAYGIEEAEFLSKLPILCSRIAQDAGHEMNLHASEKDMEQLLQQVYYGG